MRNIVNKLEVLNAKHAIKLTTDMKIILQLNSSEQ